MSPVGQGHTRVVEALEQLLEPVGIDWKNVRAGNDRNLSMRLGQSKIQAASEGERVRLNVQDMHRVVRGDFQRAVG